MAERVGDHVQVRPPHVTAHVFHSQAGPGGRDYPGSTRRLASVRFSATANSRFVLRPRSYTNVRYAWPRDQAISSTPKAVRRSDLDAPDPLDRVLHGTAHAVPGRAEDRADFAPAQPLGQGRRMPAVRGRQLVLAIAPRHHLRPSPRIVCSPLVASGRPGRPDCPRSARTRIAVPRGDHTVVRDARNRSRTDDCSCGAHLNEQRRPIVRTPRSCTRRTANDLNFSTRSRIVWIRILRHDRLEILHLRSFPIGDHRSVPSISSL